MKEVQEIMMNPVAVLLDGVLMPHAEVVIVYSEPHYRLDEQGEIKSVRHLGSLRVGMSPGRMRAFAKGLLGAADTLERELAAATVTNAIKPKPADQTG